VIPRVEFKVISLVQPAVVLAAESAIVPLDKPATKKNKKVEFISSSEYEFNPDIKNELFYCETMTLSKPIDVLG
jgi:hypothetical protein